MSSSSTLTASLLHLQQKTATTSSSTSSSHHCQPVANTREPPNPTLASCTSNNFGQDNNNNFQQQQQIVSEQHQQHQFFIHSCEPLIDLQREPQQTQHSNNTNNDINNNMIVHDRPTMSISTNNYTNEFHQEEKNGFPNISYNSGSDVINLNDHGNTSSSHSHTLIAATSSSTTPSNSLSFFEFLNDDSSSVTTSSSLSPSSNNTDGSNQNHSVPAVAAHTQQQPQHSSPRNPSTPSSSRPKSLSILSSSSTTTASFNGSSSSTAATNMMDPIGNGHSLHHEKNVDKRRSLKRLANHSSSTSSLFSSRENTPPPPSSQQQHHSQQFHYSPHNIHYSSMYSHQQSPNAGQFPPVVSLPLTRDYPFRANSSTSPTSSSVMNIRVYSPPGDDEDSVSNQSSQHKTNRSSFSSLNSSMIFEDDNIYDFTCGIAGRSIHLIHLLLHPTTKALFKDYCEKIRVLELFDCLESIRLYYVAIDTFKSEAHKKKIDDLRITLNLNNSSISVDDLMVSGMASSNGDKRKQDTKKKRVSLSSSNSKTFKSKRQSVALLFNNNNLLEALQQKLNSDMGLDSYSQSLSGLFTLGGSERDQIHIEDISKEGRESLKQKAEAIFNEFLSPQSTREINVDASVRSSIQTSLKSLKNCENEHTCSLFETIFDELRIIILRQLKTDVLFRFEKSDTWLSFLSNPAHKDIVAQVLDYSNSVWSSNNCHSGQCYTKFTKKEFVRDYVNVEDFNFLKQVIFSYHGRNWQTLKPTTTDSPFSIYYSKGKYYVDQEALGIKFGCFKETANLPFSAEEVLSAMHSKLVQSVLDETLNVDATLFCLKTIPHRHMEGILPGNVTKLAIDLPIVLSNQRCCYQALSIMYDPTSERYYSISKPILFNENYTFSEKDVQGIVINMMCVERVTETSCKYSNVIISNFGGILKHKVFKKVPLKRAKNVQALLFEQLKENRNNLFNTVRDGYEVCLDLLTRYSICSNVAISQFPKSFGEFQEKFCGYY